MVPLFTISDDTDGLRAGELGHAVEHAHENGDFGRLRIGSACPQARTGERLEPVHCILGQRTTVVAALLLPFVSTALCNGVERGVAPERAGCGRRPVNRAVARRNRGRRTTRGDRGIAGLRIVCAVAADGIDGLVDWDLIKQFGKYFVNRQ